MIHEHGMARSSCARHVALALLRGGGTGPTDNPSGHICLGEIYVESLPLSRTYDTFRHELLHALGFGTGQFWQEMLRNPFTGDRDNPPDTYFVGENAYRAFLELGGGVFYATEGVPVANGSPTNVQPNSHWRSAIIDNDVMVGCDDVAAYYDNLECGDVPPVSKITLGALADMGWIVDMDMAEAGTRTGCFRECRGW